MTTTEQKTLGIRLATSAYQNEKDMNDTVYAVEVLVGSKGIVHFSSNGMDAAGFSVECTDRGDPEEFAVAIAKLPHIEYVSMHTDENLGEGNYSYFTFTKANGQINRAKEYEWKSADNDPYRQKLNILFNTAAYETDGMRENIVKTIRALPEVKKVRHVSDGINPDTCTVTIKDAAVRSDISKKISQIPGVNCTFEW